jgi:glycosyltransferase involved in cell wall biosynthesis
MRRVLLAFEPPDGGVAENVEQLATALGNWGWEVELAAPQRSSIEERAVAAGMPVHRLDWVRGYGRPRRDWLAVRQLTRILRTGAFDLVHCHSAKAGAVGRPVAAVARVPAVYSPHCFAFVADLGVAWRIVSTTVERALAPLTDQIICVCEDERRQARRIGIADRRLAVVLNGCPPCPAAAEPAGATARFAGDGPVVASIAVLREQKRIDVLIDAAPSILARVPDAKVAVIGDGPLREALVERADRLGLDRDPRFAFLPFESSQSHLAATDVFVLPSAWEALSIGLLEALACGVPTVATDVGGSREVVVPETGLLVPPSDPAALADAVVALLLDPDRRKRMSVAARERHAERFRLERMVEETAAVYDRAVSTRSRRHRH